MRTWVSDGHCVGKAGRLLAMIAETGERSCARAAGWRYRLSRMMAAASTSRSWKPVASSG